VRPPRPAIRALVPALLCVLALLAAGCRTSPPAPRVTKSAAPSASAPAPEPHHNQAVVAVDGVAGGYNPHKLADQSTITTALAALMLPSVFRRTTDGHWRLDRTVMRSAKVTSTGPFTVTYRIRPAAAWSDGVPIRAEDFAYLRSRMTSQPGVVDPAGYELISGISARAGGTTVVVSFEEPYPAWRNLFSDLLPAHLLKDAPGGWSGALATGYPASGGPFQVGSVAVARGQVVLRRNDRYWGRPSRLRRITFLADSPAGESAPGAAARLLSEGGAQVGVLRATRDTRRALAKLPEKRVGTRTVSRHQVAQLTLRPADEGLRKAIAAGIDRKKLIAAGTQDAKHRHRVDSLVGASAASAKTSMPAGAPGARPNPEAAPRLLRQVGYHRSSGSGWRKDGKTLRVIVGAVHAEPYDAIATELVAELNAAGLPARRRTSQSGPPYGRTTEPVDVIVGPRPSGGAPVSELASELGCVGEGASGHEQPAHRARHRDRADLCDPELAPLIEEALSGRIPAEEALDAVAPHIWSQAVIVPLFQITDIVAVDRTIHGAAREGGAAALFAGAPAWSRTGK
jgi:ABC-type transport system substrate-binding protein